MNFKPLPCNAITALTEHTWFENAAEGVGTEAGDAWDVAEREMVDVPQGGMLGGPRRQWAAV